MGDVASVAAAVHDALGGDAAREHDEGDDAEGDDDESAQRGGGARDASALKKKRRRETARAAVRFMGPRASRARSSVVALDCVAELVYASE